MVRARLGVTTFQCTAALIAFPAQPERGSTGAWLPPRPGSRHELDPPERRQRRYEAPLKSSTAPDAHSASVDASQTTADAISSGRATRPNGLWAE